MDRNYKTWVRSPLSNLTEPAAIAFSGGGDSTALLHACAAHPFITHAFIIDHALRAGSAAEVERSAEFARSLGYQVRTERWTLHRPWLDVSRAELRAYNADMKLEYVDDPSNENRDFTRVRARQALAIDQDLRADLLKQQTEALDRLNVERRNEANWLSRFANISPDGFVETSAVPTPELLLHMLNSVSGQGGPIDAAKRRRLVNAMTDSDFSGMTLSGAWIKKTLDGFLFTRDN